MFRPDEQLYEDSFDKCAFISQKSISSHLHYHAELIISLEGSFEAIVDGKRLLVHEGSGVIVFPYQLHEYIAIDSKIAVVLLMHPEKNPKIYEYFKSNIPISPHIPSELVDDEVIDILKYIQCHYDQSKPTVNVELSSIYREAIYTLLLPKLQYGSVSDDRLDLMHNILNYCQKHFTEPITIPSAAKAMFISESKLSHFFSCTMHIGFREYINSLRVQMATELLRNTTIPISEIAFDCGFSSFSTFNRAFRDSYDLTPREIRSRGNAPIPEDGNTKQNLKRMKSDRKKDS